MVTIKHSTALPAALKWWSLLKYTAAQV